MASIRALTSKVAWAVPMLIAGCSNGEAEASCKQELARRDTVTKAVIAEQSSKTLMDVYNGLSETVAPQMIPFEYPKTYNSLGGAAFDRANSLVKWAAVAVIEKGSCDIDVVMVSEKSSANVLNFFAICKDGRKEYASDTDAQNAKQAALSGAKLSVPAIRASNDTDFAACVEQYEELHS